MSLLAALVVPLVCALLPLRGGEAPGRWPLHPPTGPPEVVSGFDPPDLPWAAGHRGVDLLGAAGAAVYADLPGTVSFAGRVAGVAVVVVDHGDTRSTFEPVDPAVAVGDRVGTGDRIGTLERFGSHCFPRACLHWGLLRGETYLDPLGLVGAAPVRLLPLDGLGAPAARAPVLPHASAGPLPPAAPGSPRGRGALFRAA